MQVKEPSFVTIGGRKMAYDEVKPANPKGTVLLLTGLASKRLGQIKVPTLVVHGDTDPLVPTENGHFLAKNIEGAKLVLYPQTGHIPIIEKAEEYNRDVLAFLES